MSKDAGRRGWQQAIEARLSGTQQANFGPGQVARIWLTALTIVVLACAAFFLTLYWLFG